MITRTDLGRKLDNWTAPTWLIEVLTVVPAVILGVAAAAVLGVVFRPAVELVQYAARPWLTTGYWWRSGAGWEAMGQPLLAALLVGALGGLLAGLIRGLPAAVSAGTKAWEAWSLWMAKHARQTSDDEPDPGLVDLVRTSAARARDRLRGDRRLELPAGPELDPWDEPEEEAAGGHWATVTPLDSRRPTPAPEELAEDAQRPVWPGWDGQEGWPILNPLLDPPKQNVDDGNGEPPSSGGGKPVNRH